MLMLALAIMSGVTGWFVHFIIPPFWFDGIAETPTAVAKLAFWLPFLYGFVSSVVVLRVVSSAVDSVVVCFAESPNELRTSHSYIYQRMVDAWRMAYPTDCGF